ncbi:MAG TPA: hypothetical protein VHT05_14025 [Candidatus Elarobacter sp.]|nr:hypothetical protein [Candidatus Elarobacter sp.]
MPSSADRAPGGAPESPRDVVVRTIIALERSCLDAESAFVNRRWNDVGTAFSTQRELTGELRRLFSLAPEAAPANDQKVARRMRGVLAYRDDQLRRMRAYHDDVGERLRSIGKVRALARTIGRRRASGRLVDGTY